MYVYYTKKGTRITFPHTHRDSCTRRNFKMYAGVVKYEKTYLTILWFIYTPEDIVATHAFGLTLYI